MGYIDIISAVSCAHHSTNKAGCLSPRAHTLTYTIRQGLEVSLESIKLLQYPVKWLHLVYEGILQGERGLQCEIGYLEAAAAAAGRKSLLSAHRWVPSGVRISKEATRSDTRPVEQRREMTRHKLQRGFVRHKRGFHSALATIQLLLCSSQSVQGLIVGPVRFTHIFYGNIHPD